MIAFAEKHIKIINHLNNNSFKPVIVRVVEEASVGA